MELYQNLCKNCGGDLHSTEDGKFKCAFCASVFESKAVDDYAEEMRTLFDEFKLESISNARRNLYEAVNAEYISNNHVHECVMALKQLIPDDFQANFYEIAIGNAPRKLAKTIRRIDVAENASAIDSIVRFLILSLQSEFVTEVGDLIERAYKNLDLVKYEKYSTALSEEAEKIDNCIYMTSYPRDVFVAYSSKDMKKVMELVECLEAQGFSCFVAARNLRHGRGAVENYDKALREAMNNCTSFVFVSSTNSRHPGCDALKKEIPYIKGLDIENAPPEFKKEYIKIPHKYKIHRVEYRLEESPRLVAADRIVNEFFDGYERVYSPEEVAERIIQFSTIVNDDHEEKAVEPEKTKFCIACLAECKESLESCPSCNGTKFASTRMEAELMKELVSSRKRNAANDASAVNNAAISSAVALLKRAFIFLEDENWEEANAYCEKVLDIDPETAEAYLGKMMVELRVKSRNALSSLENPFDNNNNYKKIIRFGNDEIKAEIEGYLNQINYRIEQARLEELYIKATEAMTIAETEDDYKNVSVLFAEIKGYKDSEELAEKCLELAEQTRLEGLYAEASEATKTAKTETEYKNVSVAFAAIKGYKDSEELAEQYLKLAEEARIAVLEKAYSAAMRVLNVARTEVEYKKTSTMFAAIPEYKDAAKLSQKCLELAEQAKKDCEQRSIDILNFKYDMFKKSYSVKNIKKFNETEIIIPSDYNGQPVTSIGKCAFSWCSSLKTVIIPDSVTEIGAQAFEDCNNLKNIVIPNTVTKIGNGAFCDCQCIASITIPSGVTSIPNELFKGCSNLKSVVIPESVTSIGSRAFSGCGTIKSITIPKSVTTISNEAFKGCDSLKTVYYTGSEEDFSLIHINLSNSGLENAKIVYNYASK